MWISQGSHIRVYLTAFILLSLGSAGYAAPGPRAGTAQEATPLTDGRELFRTYCASCHGVSGTGNGPATGAMRRKPPDITGLEIANGGIFPSDRVQRIIDGREVESHGDREMPVWGDAFKAMQGGNSEEKIRTRITAILDYLKSIQRRLA